MQGEITKRRFSSQLAILGLVTTLCIMPPNLTPFMACTSPRWLAQLPNLAIRNKQDEPADHYSKYTQVIVIRCGGNFRGTTSCCQLGICISVTLSAVPSAEIEQCLIEHTYGAQADHLSPEPRHIGRLYSLLFFAMSM